MALQETGTILDRIIANTRADVARDRETTPLQDMQRRAVAAPPVRDFAAALRQPGRTTLIAEVKKASPSRGVLLPDFDHLALAQTYSDNGASALSVLTDVRFFQGSLDYLEAIRRSQPDDGPGAVPLLRKDFIVDSYQVVQARAHGADALLLIVAALDDATLVALLEHTYALGMHALVEVHSPAELGRALAAGAQIIGVNNRDLHTFDTTLDTTAAVAAHLPADNRPILVSESGIFSAADVALVRGHGADAVLVGEALVTAPDIAAKVRELAGLAE